VIKVLEGMPAGVLGFEASGKLTRSDYADVLAPALAAGSEGGGKVRVLLRFSGEFDGMEAGAVWQDVRMGVSEWRAWERIALVTDHDWMRTGMHLFAWAVPGEVKAFEDDDLDDAVAWLAAGDGAADDPADDA
jgi:hypothetical protein